MYNMLRKFSLLAAGLMLMGVIAMAPSQASANQTFYLTTSKTFDASVVAGVAVPGLVEVDHVIYSERSTKVIDLKPDSLSYIPAFTLVAAGAALKGGEGVSPFI